MKATESKMVASLHTSKTPNPFRVVRALLVISALLVVCYLSLLFEVVHRPHQVRFSASPNDQVHSLAIKKSRKESRKVEFMLSKPLSSANSLIGHNVKFEAQLEQSEPLSNANYLNDPSFESKKVNQNTFKRTKEAPVSTFSADVDTSSYSYIRRLLQSSFRMPAPNTVHTEELINYFDYDYPCPQDKSSPLEASVMISNSPWCAGRKIMSIGIKGYDHTKVMDRPRPKSNLVFLIDVSGSMASPDCLPMAKESLELLLGGLQPDDHVSIITYASGTKIALPPTPVSQKETILAVIKSLYALGSTNGSGGLELAYKVAGENFDETAVNRIMLFTDGDFNVGLTRGDALTRYISEKRSTGIFLSVFGFGPSGQYRDGTMKALANHGNGVAVYIDSIKEAQKALVQEAQSTLYTIAKDVKFQVEFNPNRVAEYRLMGYKKRLLAREDFHNDSVDAGDIGAGHTVTVLYEFTPVEEDLTVSAVDDLRYGMAPAVGNKKSQLTEKDPLPLDNEYAFLKMRYKLPTEETSKLVTQPITDTANLELLVRQGGRAATIAQEFRFAAAVAGFSELLKGNIHEGRQQSSVASDLPDAGGKHHHWTWSDVVALAESNLGNDPYQYRREFVNLVRAAKSIDREVNNVR
eukprot:CAMPEP_0113638972 /NCGR_PEP_ID=MMETSP0017_2-20120614/20431_1 /TAXON_ID=2856 /ORGANISM="Cylindrotheca closterium" /LENGTH=636 /DNA_ID=CAMNT_0000550135 /DNA_START=39 /DNA_END=1949 /DNA_ORIENTATION=- /assembly_acc=CAM_ASM_000147